MRNFYAPAILALLVCPLVDNALAADPARNGLYFEQQVATTVDQRPSEPQIIARVWRQGSRMRLEQSVVGRQDKATVLIVRLDQGRAFRLDPAQRMAREIDLEAERARARSELGVAGGQLGVKAPAARIRRSRQIAGYACQGYRLQAATGAVDVWVSHAVPADMEAFSDFLEWLGAEEALATFLDSLRRLPGFPLEVRSRLDVSGRIVETRATVTRIRVGAVPESLFDVPPRYRVEPALAGDR
jgi:hypothetical protein